MSDRLPQTTPRKMVQALQGLGFIVVRTKGSHIYLRRGEREVLVAYHGRDLPRAILMAIIKQAGLTIEEIRDYL